jgi:hypothetical protein
MNFILFRKKQVRDMSKKFKGCVQVRISKELTKKCGKCSIYDIINSNLSLEAKINDIRHHYTFYEGNYEVFHDEDGKPTEAKHTLNEIIRKVILGRLDASALKQANNVILEWKKEYLEKREELQLQKKKEVEFQEPVDVVPYVVPPLLRYLEETRCIADREHIQPYLDRIEQYLKANPDANHENLSYKQLKSYSGKWYCKVQNVMNEEEKEKRRLDNLAAKRYAKELGYAVN